jgi:hypothetical protein
MLLFGIQHGPQQNAMMFAPQLVDDGLNCIRACSMPFE